MPVDPPANPESPAGKGRRRVNARDTPEADPKPEEQHPALESPFPIVGVGASAGGLEAFSRLLQALPADIGMAFVLIQHLDPTHESMLGEILQRESRLPVEVAANNTAVAVNHVYVIPPGSDMVIRHGVLRLSPRQSPARGGPHGVDHFLRSLAHDQRHKAIGVILSGTATDGAAGLQEIKAEGGITFAQDGSAQHGGMPNSAIATGCVDSVLPPERIAAELARMARLPYLAAAVPAPDEPGHPSRGLRGVLDAIHKATGVDFTGYKYNTLHRRIGRRMALCKVDSLDDYVAMLRRKPAEAKSLFEDILINVTRFFRDPEAFAALKERVFPKLEERRQDGQAVRLWVLGCSTGEEVYSLAIAWAEFADEHDVQVPLQIFATDLSATDIDRARTGTYSRNIAQDVSAERLRRFFNDVNGSYQIKKGIRDACVFAVHNALADPPFSRLDLVTCRNLLIYLDASAQQRIVPMLHYALLPEGFLLLGNSETLGSYREYFDPVDAHNKIFSKKGHSTLLRAGFPMVRRRMESERPPDEKGAPETPVRVPDPLREADRILLSRYAPAGVLVSADMEVLQYRGDTSPFLTHPPGRASLQLSRMLREGLSAPAREALQEARRAHHNVRREGLRVRAQGGPRVVDLEVIPVHGDTREAGAYLILFDERRKGEPPPAPAPDAATGRSAGEADAEMEQLRSEVKSSREHLQSVIEQQEAANEELQSANEEVQSANEELQSINEELETSKEEIQASNEELVSVNDELQNRNRELGKVSNDLANLLASVQMAIVMLGPDLRIRRFTPLAERLFNLVPADVGRAFSDIRSSFEAGDLRGLIEEVIDTAIPREIEVRDTQGRWYALRLRPYRTLEDKIDGAVLMLVDVDSLKRALESQQRLSELLEQTHEPVFAWKLDGVITYWNTGAERVYGYRPDEAMGKPASDLLKSSVSLATVRRMLLDSGEWRGELTRRRKDGSTVLVEARMVLGTQPAERTVVLETDNPITERRALEERARRQAEELAVADRSKNDFLAILAHELRNPLASLRAAMDMFDRSRDDAAALEQMRAIVDRQIRNMTRMVSDLFDIARLERHQIALRRETVDLVALLAEQVATMRDRPEARDRNLSLQRPDAPVYVLGDSTRLEQIFANLLTNALKFTQPGGNIMVTVTVEEPRHGDGEAAATGTDSYAEIRVRDDGIGIAPEDLPVLFNAFMQANRALIRTSGGMGIGLTMARRLLELHGGGVEAHSEGLGKGSEFVVRLPTTAVPAEKKKSQAAQPAPTAIQTSHRILVIDDNQDAADAIAMVLRANKHDVRVAYSGRSALQQAREFKPELALIDVSLPDMDGFEVAHLLRTDLGLTDTRCIGVSGYSQRDLQRWRSDASFDEYLTKPVEMSRLLQVINGKQGKA